MYAKGPKARRIKSFFVIFDGVEFSPFSVFIDGSVLVLLIFRDQILHVGLGFREFHFVHALAGVPVGRGTTGDEDTKRKFTGLYVFTIKV